ncbi:hypothetical protein VN97_g8651 [Penicillium thymicola]|uniref:Uncharacterized protein n=1 Tax=Penicillium thymicola TaxID=293382 RepID=A0AAI9TDE5_PENTH|nr:hypothetical protein VN97_g8651 [Penicillium thymicola]
MHSPGEEWKNKRMDSRGIEPRTTPMLREYYTTKPQAQFDGRGSLLTCHKPKQLFFLKLLGQGQLLTRYLQSRGLMSEAPQQY